MATINRTDSTNRIYKLLNDFVKLMNNNVYDMILIFDIKTYLMTHVSREWLREMGAADSLQGPDNQSINVNGAGQIHCIPIEGQCMSHVRKNRGSMVL